MKKKLISALLIMTLLSLTFMGCQKAGNSGDKGNNTGSKDTVTKVPDKGEDVSNEVDIWAPFAEPVVLHTVTSEFTDVTYPEGDDATNNVWVRAFKEKFNVDLVTDWVSDEYSTKLNLSIAEGKLPDVFRVNNSQFQQLIEADLIMDLSEVFETYASDTLKGYMKADYETYESGMRDGKLYGIPQMHYGIIEQPDYVWIRNDWKEELGLADPETMDDLVHICKEFMKNYGGYGMATDSSLNFLNLLAIGWGAHPGIWIEKDGQIEYGSIQPEMKDALAAWAQWYKDGIINKDFITTDHSKMNEDVISGKVGVHPFYQWWGYAPGMDVAANLGDEAHFRPYMIPSANGQEVKHSISFANGSYTVVSKKCKNSEAVIKLINFYAYMIDDSAAETAETVSAFTDLGMSHVAGAFTVINPESDYNQYVQIIEAINTGDTSVITNSVNLMKYNNCIDYIENKNPANIGFYLQVGFEGSAYGLGKEILDKGMYVKSKLWGQSPQTLLDSGSTLNDILTEGFTRIIIGDQPIDYFDTLVSNWKTAGGDKATQEVNEMYNK